MIFYRSFGKKSKDGVCFHADWEGIGRGFLVFRRG
jgi:hypothetical protein